MRRTVKILAVVALGGVAVVAAAVIWEWTYIERIWTYPQDEITAAAWYQPTETVHGRAPAELPTADRATIDADALAAVAGYARQRNSAALVVVHRGRIIAEHYWHGHDRLAATNSMSMAKTVVALLVGIAVNDGRIGSIDDPAARYLHEWADDERRSITIRHLLQMTSGLGNAEHNEDPFSDIGYMYLGTDSRWIVANVPLAATPGAGFVYNSINSEALSMILEQATGVRYAAYLSEKLWTPLGARDASVWLDREQGRAKASCCLLATARDWARVGVLIAHGGRAGDRQIVPAAWIRQMSLASAVEPDYGLQLWLGNDGIRTEDHAEPFAASDVVYLDGRHKQRVYIVPSEDLVIVRVGEEADDWDEAFLVNTLLRGIRAGRPPPPPG